MPSTPRRSLLAILVVLAIPTAIAWPAPVVVETNALSPEEQRAKFKLPPGFEIQLVAAEPDINKPMNLAFDAAGRLWVTTSTEYPYAAPTAPVPSSTSSRRSVTSIRLKNFRCL